MPATGQFYSPAVGDPIHRVIHPSEDPVNRQFDNSHEDAPRYCPSETPETLLVFSVLWAVLYAKPRRCRGPRWTGNSPALLRCFGCFGPRGR